MSGLLPEPLRRFFRVCGRQSPPLLCALLAGSGCASELGDPGHDIDFLPRSGAGGVGGSVGFDQTLMLWAREMGDAVEHRGDDMRFVFAGGAGGYLRTSPDGRYIDGGGGAHQRALISAAEALGITNFAGFGATGGAPESRTALESLRA
jgi:hypothetical protein